MWKHPSRCGYRSLRRFKAWTTRLFDALWLISCDELLFFTETTETTQSWARDMGYCEMSQPPKRPSFRCFDRFKFCRSRVLGKSMILHDIILFHDDPQFWSIRTLSPPVNHQVARTRRRKATRRPTPPKRSAMPCRRPGLGAQAAMNK